MANPKESSIQKCPAEFMTAGLHCRGCPQIGEKGCFKTEGTTQFSGGSATPGTGEQQLYYNGSRHSTRPGIEP